MVAKVLLFDLWMTLVYGLPTDPIHTLQSILKHRSPVEPLDPAFLRKCLTTDLKNPSDFLHEVAATFNLKVPRGALTQFRQLLRQERAAATAYDDTDVVLKALAAGGEYRLGLISNLWPFPVHRIFNRMGMGKHFEHLVYSFEHGAAKPSASIFQHASELFDVSPEHCIMIGDSVSSDIEGALGAGMQAILIDRSEKLHPQLSQQGVTVVRSLTELQTMLR